MSNSGDFDIDARLEEELLKIYPTSTQIQQQLEQLKTKLEAPFGEIHQSNKHKAKKHIDKIVQQYVEEILSIMNSFSTNWDIDVELPKILKDKVTSLRKELKTFLDDSHDDIDKILELFKDKVIKSNEKLRLKRRIIRKNELEKRRKFDPSHQLETAVQLYEKQMQKLFSQENVQSDKKLYKTHEVIKTQLAKDITTEEAKLKFMNTVDYILVDIRQENRAKRNIEDMKNEIVELNRVSSKDVDETKLIPAIENYRSEMEKKLALCVCLTSEELDDAHNAAAKLSRAPFENKPGLKNRLSQKIDILFNQYKDRNVMNTVKDPAVGIDLGTSNSCVSVYLRPIGQSPGKVVVIPNQEGKNTTPSYVGVYDGRVVVGEAARSRSVLDPDKTFFDVKRLIGRRFNEDVVQNDIKNWPFKVVLADDKKTPLLKSDKTSYHPEEISAEILKKLKLAAEGYLKTSVKKAVITVPAYFTDGQKQATIDAGRIAGLEVLKIITEPAAAAIAYRSLHSPEASTINALVFDFGGGTFDVAVLSMCGKIIKIRAVDGDTHLGGSDIDSNVLEHCLTEFEMKTGVNWREKYQTSRARNKARLQRNLRKLESTCEKEKCNLSSSGDVEILLDNFYGNKDLEVRITLDKFDQLNRSIYEKTLKITQRAIESAKMVKEEIDEIILVGGSTRIPKIQEMLSEYFNGKALCRSLHQDEAVGYGAAVMAAILNGATDKTSLHNFSVTTTIPRSIGIEVRKEIGCLPSGKRIYGPKNFSIVIPKNTAAPTSDICDTFWTGEDNQTGMDIKIYEGEDRIPTNNHFLGNFYMTGIPAAASGKESIKLTMNINDDGILHTTAVCESNGARNELTISENKFRLNEEDIRRAANHT